MNHLFVPLSMGSIYGGIYFWFAREAEPDRSSMIPRVVRQQSRGTNGRQLKKPIESMASKHIKSEPMLLLVLWMTGCGNLHVHLKVKVYLNDQQSVTNIAMLGKDHSMQLCLHTRIR